MGFRGKIAVLSLTLQIHNQNYSHQYQVSCNHHQCSKCICKKTEEIEGKCSIILCKKCSCFKRKHEGDNEDLRLSSQFQSMIDAISSSEDELEDDDYSLPDIDNYNFDYEFVE